MEIRNLPKHTEVKIHADTTLILESILAAEKFFLVNVSVLEHIVIYRDNPYFCQHYNSLMI